jgi:spermidine/putrescine transport system permease protein
MFLVSIAIYFAVMGLGRATGLVVKRRPAKKAGA